MLYDASAINSQQPKSDYPSAIIRRFRSCTSSNCLALPAPLQMQVSAALQSYSGSVLPTRWSIGRTTRYAADCKGPCTPNALVIPNMTATTYVLDLTPPGANYYERLNQLDVSLRIVRSGDTSSPGRWTVNVNPRAM